MLKHDDKAADNSCQFGRQNTTFGTSPDAPCLAAVGCSRTRLLLLFFCLVAFADSPIDCNGHLQCDAGELQSQAKTPAYVEVGKLAEVMLNIQQPE